MHSPLDYLQQHYQGLHLQMIVLNCNASPSWTRHPPDCDVHDVNGIGRLLLPVVGLQILVGGGLIFVGETAALDCNVESDEMEIVP